MNKKNVFLWFCLVISLGVLILFSVLFIYPKDIKKINEVSIVSKIEEIDPYDLEERTKVSLVFSDGMCFESYLSQLDDSERFILNLEVGDSICYKFKSRRKQDIKLIKVSQD